MNAAKQVNARVGGGVKVHATYTIGHNRFTRCGAEGVTIRPAPLRPTEDAVTCARCKRITQSEQHPAA